MDRVRAAFIAGIKILRENRRLTQEEFSAEVDVPLRTYQKYESGKIFPHTSVLSSIVEFCGISPSELFDSKALKLPEKTASQLTPQEFVDEVTKKLKVTPQKSSNTHEKLFVLARKLPPEVIEKYIAVFSDEVDDLTLRSKKTTRLK